MLQKILNSKWIDILYILLFISGTTLAIFMNRYYMIAIFSLMFIFNYRKWFWYYIFDPRGILDFRKNINKGRNITTDILHETHGKVIQDKAEKRRKNSEKRRQRKDRKNNR